MPLPLRPLDRLVDACLHHPRRVLLAWLLLAIVAAVGAGRVTSVLVSDQAVAGSESARVDERLQTEFRHPFTFPAYVVLDGLPTERTAAERVIRHVQATLTAASDVEATASPLTLDGDMLGTPGQGPVTVVAGLRARTVPAAMAAIPRVRDALRHAIEAQRLQIPTLNAAITGETALNVDMSDATAQDAAKAEQRAVPITLVLLLVVFGSFAAACLPILVGMIGTLVTLGIVYLIGQIEPQSGLVVSIATLMGLGVGTDAGLFLVSRYREERRAGKDLHDAVATAIRTVGMALCGSSATVMIGFGAMLTIPVSAIRSIGLGGLIEVGLCTAVALTAVPALIVLLGDKLDWPSGLGRLIQRWQPPNLWAAWAQSVMKRPWLGLVAGLLILGSLAAPTRQMAVGLPDLSWVPARLEAAKGMALLDKQPHAPGIWSLQVILDAPQGQSLMDPASIDGLFALTEHLGAVPGVAAVQGLTRPPADVPAWQVRLMLANPEQAKLLYPDVFRLFVNPAGTAARFVVVPAKGIGMAAGIALTERLRKLDLDDVNGLKGWRLTVGGPLADAVDFRTALLAPFPRLIAGVLLATGLMVLVLYRSVLLPIKAVVLNGLSVLATFGTLVTVFQQGHGLTWLNTQQSATGVVIVAVPVLVFCIVFGLSMDYELLMLSRIRERYVATGDNRAATAAGLAETGSLITQAALIMGIAFGAFACAELVTLQMVGVGLTVAVALDATVVRLLLVPSVMRLAGRWNWWPGDRR